MVDARIEEGLKRLGLPVSAGSEVGRVEQEEVVRMVPSYAEVLSSVGSITGEGPSGSRKEQSYNRCRRSLRLRPIGQGSEAELVKEFMRTYLRIDDAGIERLGAFTVERVPYGPKTRHKDEAIVHFSTVEARDVVRSSASNLAGCGQEVGIRLEIPSHMRAAMRALQGVSYDIKMRHKKSRRNILFDDDTCELVLDFSLGDDRPWKRLTTKQAMARRRAGVSEGGRTGLDEDELDEILGASAGPSGGRRQDVRRGFGDDQDYQN